METIVSLSIVLLISVVALGIVIGIGMPVIRTAVDSSEIQNAENDMKFIDDYIKTVAAEGKDSVRIYKFSSPKLFESIPGEDTVQFSKTTDATFIDYLTRKITGNFLYTSGGTVDCLEQDGYYIAENERMKAVFRKISGAIDTADILARITQKTSGVEVSVGSTAVMINEDPATSTGTGYTEISFSGRQLPVCQIHASVDSTMDYDVYYKLYSGADFLVVEIRNIS